MALPSPPVNDAPETRDSEETVRVRLGALSGPYSVSGENLRLTGLVPPLAGYGAVRIAVRKLDREWSEWTVTERDGGRPLARVKARQFIVSGRNLRLNLKPLPGRLTLVPRSSAIAADVIAEIGLEAYVRGVLPAEMPSAWPLEALKAQAIAARTYALYRKALRARAGYDLEASVMDQMYLFPESTEDQANVERAVAMTRGQILLGRQAPLQPLAAYFHADCGGRTEDAIAVWGSAGAGTAVDRGCPLNPLAHWRVAIDLVELANRVRAASGKAPEARLTGASVEGHTLSGRVARVRLKWSDGTSNDMAAPAFRMAIGHERIKSTNFEIAARGADALVFSGKGFGHGVGLCQWGARHMAKTGADFRAILQHYYPRGLLANVAALTAAARMRPLAENR